LSRRDRRTKTYVFELIFRPRIRKPDIVILRPIRTQVLIALFSLLFSAGCGRPFVEISSPQSVVIDPDLSFAQIETEIVLKVESTAFRDVTRVLVNGVNMSRVAGDELWELPVTLAAGINLLEIEAFDSEDRRGVDSVYAMQLDYELAQNSTLLPKSLGGHTATRLSDDTIFVTGGSTNLAAEAENGTLLLLPDASGVDASTPPLFSERVGHTATNIGDDLILIVGGASTAEISSADELIETAELYSHATRSIREIPVSGPPIRRMYHTATFRNSSQGTILDLVGGTGDVQYTPEPLLSVRGDIRSFLLRNDSLIALSPSIGPFIEQLSGHIQIPITNDLPGEPAAFLMAGVGGIPPGGPTALQMDFTTEFGILVDPVVQTFKTRTLHSAAKLDDDLVGMFGGTNWPAGDIIADTELYVPSTGHSFSLPEVSGNRFSERYAHTATILFSGEVLLLGGFNSTGNALSLGSIFSYSIGR
jgi:hypothetical protein